MHSWTNHPVLGDEALKEHANWMTPLLSYLQKGRWKAIERSKRNVGWVIVIMEYHEAVRYEGKKLWERWLDIESYVGLQGLVDLDEAFATLSIVFSLGKCSDRPYKKYGFFFLFSNNFKSFLTMGLPLQVITYIKQNRIKAAWKDAGEHEVPLPGASWNFHTPPSLKAPRDPENTVLSSLKAALGGLF